MALIRAIVGSVIGKTIFAILAIVAVSIGFGSDYWVRLVSGWAAEPLGLTLNAARLIFILVAFILLAILIWPWIKSRIWPDPICHVENIILPAGLTTPTTCPVSLIADARTANDRLQIWVEYSYFQRA
jgi:hypothetical protein